MAKKTPRIAAFVSSFTPRKCGIATFTSDLINNLTIVAGEEFKPLVVAMRSDNEIQYNEPVKFEIRQNVKNDYICAADYLNFSHVDVVSIQHEFGLFGGEAGKYIDLLLHRINAPIITTLHTVLDEPDNEYHRSLVNLCKISHKVVVMNKYGIDILQGIYGINKDKVELIPHGIPDLPFADSNYYKRKFHMEGRKTILTFGLLGRNKGIEIMLNAMATIVEADPDVLYIILGMTHPEVLRHEGESYRYQLQRIVSDLKLEKNVIFHNRFVDSHELYNFICAADIYVTPYLNREQLTSGTLAFAVGTGKAIVSTPYRAAQDLLDNGRGKLVRFNDPEHLAETILSILENPTLFNMMRKQTYDYGRCMTWPKVSRAYWDLLNKTDLPTRISTRPVPSLEQAISILEVPEPPLEHIKRLTDNTGILQHAMFTIPKRHHGYCTDDNARAVIAMANYYNQYAEPEALRLLDIYLSFICYAQNSNGTVRNFMSFGKNWVTDEPDHDALGRVLWAFGTLMANPPSPAYLSVIKDCFDNSVKHVPRLSLKGMAYSILGMSYYLEQFPGASDIKRQLIAAANKLAEAFKTTSKSDWLWYEDMLTYDNGILPHALFVAAMTLGREEYLEIAQTTCDFLLDKIFDGEHFSFVGCKGWFKKGEKKAQFDQQPINTASVVLMLAAAQHATLESRYLIIQQRAFDWFIGENDLHTPVYDFRTKGCCDALEKNDVNLNQGAESMLSFMLSLLCILENYATIHKNQIPDSNNGTITDIKKTNGHIPITELLPREKPDKSSIDKLAQPES